MPVIVPLLRPEHGLWRAGLRRVVGVDEVGVAPTCGPVVAAAVIMPPFWFGPIALPIGAETGRLLPDLTENRAAITITAAATSATTNHPRSFILASLPGATGSLPPSPTKRALSSIGWPSPVG